MRAGRGGSAVGGSGLKSASLKGSDRLRVENEGLVSSSARKTRRKIEEVGLTLKRYACVYSWKVRYPTEKKGNGRHVVSTDLFLTRKERERRTVGEEEHESDSSTDGEQVLELLSLRWDIDR